MKKETKKESVIDEKKEKPVKDSKVDQKSIKKVETKPVKKETKEKKTKKEPQEGFFKGVRRELGHVVWPSGKELVKFSLATIGFIIFFALFFWVIEIVFAWLKSLV